jgi:hypothetical protein
VDAALERGDEVALFNRDVSNPELYPDLETRRGVRDANDLAISIQFAGDAIMGRLRSESP